MLASSRFCYHPPSRTCAQCQFPPLVSVSNITWAVKGRHLSKGRRVSKLENSQHEDHSKLRKCMTSLTAALSESSSPPAASSEGLADPSTGTLAETPSTLVVSDFFARESLDSGGADQIRDEELWHIRNGPLPGDLAEVEAFCRIFRTAEQVHNAIMEALCSLNDTGERSGPTVKDASLLEERIVSGLGCIGALLHQKKQEVLGGRPNGLGFSAVPHDDKVPPLAQFRAEMKRCCEQLESALSSYFPPVNEKFLVLHRKFRRLKNVCFDAGYPRPEGSPSHADVPNWNPVTIRPSRAERTSETDEEVVFWTGGRVTEEGMHWLIDKGFKVIVDLRAEDSADQLAAASLDAAVSSAKLRHVRLPIDPGNSPTKDQVVEFAGLVADPQNHALYLHSEEGVGRTYAMVARWREVALRSVPQVTHDALKENVSPIEAGREVADKFSVHEDQNSLHGSKSDENGSLDHELVDRDSDRTSASTKNGEEASATMITPFEAQRPTLNTFSKQAMSKFFKERRVSPSSFVRNRRTRKMTKLDSTLHDEAVPLITAIAGPAGRWGLDGPGIPRAGSKVDSLMSDGISHCLEDVVNSRISGVSESSEDSATGEQEEMGLPKNGASISVPSEKNPTKGALYQIPGVEDGGDDTDEPSVVGDMCASTTGVVRVQSRKKAEMYLVRTDGFSCTRERVKESTLAFTHPSTQQQMLMWKTPPKTILLLKKLGNELMQEAQQVASFLHHQEGMNVIVEPELHDRFASCQGFGYVQTFYNQDTSDLHERVDFVVCLGGDGVILHASNLFRSAVPPVVSFNLGSLGFLTAHPFEDYIQDLQAVIHGNSRVEGVYITLRMRLRCELFRNGKPLPGKIFDVLNEVVVDRGSNPYLCKIECFERNRLITKVQADGVIVATPTGSTAYSTAAGGSIVHPNVPCMLFTPICPHSLSFRPVILPDSALLELKVPNDARSNAWVSFDGKKRQQLSRGDSVRVCMSEHPLPTVNKSDQTDDWFRSLVRCLNWNERLEQKALTTSP